VRLNPLDGEQKERLSDALLSAFKESGLKRVLQWTMKPPKRFDYFEAQGTLPDIVFEIIEASDREEWTVNLIRAARKQNSNNQILRELAEEWGIESSTKAQPAEQRPSVAVVGDPPSGRPEESGKPATPPPHLAWRSNSASAPEEAQTETPIRFERWAARAQRQTTLLSDSQELYIRLSKTTEQLVRYESQLNRGAVGGHWQIITLGLDDALRSLITIRQRSIGVLEGSPAEEFEQHTAMLSSAIADARDLRPDELSKLRQQLAVMRSASMGTRASLKKQLDATLKSITSQGAGSQLVAHTGLLLVMWDRAFRQYELWDKCWQTVVATESEATEEFWTLVYERVGEAAQASDDLRNDIEAWTEPSMLERDLREPMEALRKAVDLVIKTQRSRAKEFQPVVGKPGSTASVFSC